MIEFNNPGWHYTQITMKTRILASDQICVHMQWEGASVHFLHSDWETPPLDVCAIFSWKVCSMIIQGKWYLWSQTLTAVCFLEAKPAVVSPPSLFPCGQTEITLSLDVTASRHSQLNQNIHSFRCLEGRDLFPSQTCSAESTDSYAEGSILSIFSVNMM